MRLPAFRVVLSGSIAMLLSLLSAVAVFAGDGVGPLPK